jgi:hypothetical protein
VKTSSQALGAVGFTVKSGWAAVVLLTVVGRTPRVLASRRVELSDPKVPESRQPYHDGFGTARKEGAALSRLLESVQTFGGRSVTRALDDLESSGTRLAGAAVVAGSLTDPETIANEHIRIHAREGQLFRRVIEDALAGRGVRCEIRRERDLWKLAADTLGIGEVDLRSKISAIDRAPDGPWRVEQKTAAVAAWLLLAHQRSEIRDQ